MSRWHWGGRSRVGTVRAWSRPGVAGAVRRVLAAAAAVAEASARDLQRCGSACSGTIASGRSPALKLPTGTERYGKISSEL